MDSAKGSRSPMKCRLVEGDEGENCRDEDEEAKEGEVEVKKSRMKKTINTNIKNGGKKKLLEEAKEEEPTGNIGDENKNFLESSYHQNHLHSSMAISSCS
mmetsp:Transcript_23969/g.18299  ORF Transcript_23969/g.18299 Transcript_23969/m.18299 type:complete len:100 (+) Transcript_23969:1061-1360(+)